MRVGEGRYERVDVVSGGVRVGVLVCVLGEDVGSGVGILLFVFGLVCVWMCGVVCVCCWLSGGGGVCVGVCVCGW